MNAVYGLQKHSTNQAKNILKRANSFQSDYTEHFKKLFKVLMCKIDLTIKTKSGKVSRHVLRLRATRGRCCSIFRICQ